MNFKYIDTVLSHITDKRKKEKIEYELFDHLDEKKKWLEEMGYDEESAIVKADEYMGDGDVVGEQLDMIKKPFLAKHFCTVLGFISLTSVIFAYSLLFSTESSGSFGRVMNSYIFSLSYFWSFIVFSTVFVIGLITMAAGLGKKSIFALCSGFASAEAVIVIGPYHYPDMIDSIFHRKSITDSFYEVAFFENILFNATTDFSIYALIVLAFSALLLATFFIGLFILVKISKLKNTKKDLKLKGVLVYLLILVGTLTLCFTASVSVQTVRETDTRINNTKSVLLKAEKGLLENFDALTQPDNKKQETAYESFLESIDMDIDYNLTYKDTLVAKRDGAEVQIYKEYDGDESSTTYCEVTIESYLIYPFDFMGLSIPIYNDYNLSKVRTMDEVPLPARLSVCTENGSTKLEFSYNDAEVIRFIYDEDTDDFKLIYNSENDTYESTALTNEQLKAFESAIKEYDLPDEDTPTLWYQIHGAYYNDITDTYMFEYSYMYYRDVIEANSIEASVYLGSGALGCRSPVKFDNDSAEILWNESELMTVGVYPDDMYATTSDLVNNIKDYYTDKSLNKIKNENLVEELKLIIYRYNTNRYYSRLYNFAPLGDFGYNGGITDSPKELPENAIDFKEMNEATIYLTADRKLYGYGSGAEFLMTNKKVSSKKPVLLLTEVDAFDMGSGYAVALRGDKLYFWGESDHGEAGVFMKMITKPRIVSDEVIDIAAAHHTLAYITCSGELYTLGDNSEGLLGNNGQDRTDASPYKVMDDCKSVVYKENGNTFYALKNDNISYFWGGNKYIKPREVSSPEVLIMYGVHYDRFNFSQNDYIYGFD